MANTVKILVAVQIPTPKSAVEKLSSSELSKEIRYIAENEVAQSLQHLNAVVLRVRLAREKA